MSWQEYVDDNMVGSGRLAYASIIGLEGSTWATSPGYAVNGNEAKALIKTFQDPTSSRSNGLYLNGTRFVVLRADNRSIYAKFGSTGIVCVKTGKCVLIGYYDENGIPGEANTVVENLADYLISVGF